MRFVLDSSAFYVTDIKNIILILFRLFNACVTKLIKSKVLFTRPETDIPNQIIITANLTRLTVFCYFNGGYNT